MGKPVIGYRNYLEEISPANITLSHAAAAGFESDLAYNWRTFDGWKSSFDGVSYYYVDLGATPPGTVDYWAVSAHTLGTNGGSIKLQHSATGAWAGEEVDFGAAVSPTDDDTIMQYTTTPISDRYWRFEVTSNPASFIGVLSLGDAMEFVRAVRVGFKLPKENRMNKVMNSRAEGGAFIGRSLIRKGIETDFQIEIQTLDYGRTTWSQFIDHAVLKPFFFCWNVDYLEDTVYAWMDGEPRPVSFDRNNSVRMGFKMQGLY